MVLSHTAATLLARMPEKKPADTTSQIRSPMPGMVVDVLVDAGDTVSIGQGLAIVDAMKMEKRAAGGTRRHRRQGARRAGRFGCRRSAADRIRNGLTARAANERAVRVRITGRVQGVWFRAWTREEARDLGLDGWVRNRADGSVEAVFAGAADDVAAMLRLCRKGPPLARVEAVTVDETDDIVEPGFRQLPTR